jgi:hypothetical protein
MRQPDLRKTGGFAQNGVIAFSFPRGTMLHSAADI